MIKKLIGKAYYRLKGAIRKNVKRALKINLKNERKLNLSNHLLSRVVLNSRVKLFSLDPISSCYDGIQLFESSEQVIYGKKSVEGHQRSGVIKLPSLMYYLLSNVLVHPLSPILIDLKKRKAVYQDYPLDKIDLKDIDYTTGFVWAHADKKIAVNITISEKHENGILFIGSYNKNWYHWTIEIMSRSVLLNELNDKYADWPLIIPKSCYESRNHIDFLQLVIKGRELVYLEDSTNLIKNVIYIDSPAILPPKLWNDSNVARLKVGNFRIDILKKYRENLFKNISEKTIQKRRNIFLTRNLNNRKYNQEEIILALKKFDFHMVQLEKLNVLEQLDMMINARIIVGPIGAAWANILFSNADCAITWVPEFAGDQPAYSTMAKIANIELVFLRFKTCTNNWVEFMKSDEEYYINPKEITKIVDDAMCNV